MRDLMKSGTGLQGASQGHSPLLYGIQLVIYETVRFLKRREHAWHGEVLLRICQTIWLLTGTIDSCEVRIYFQDLSISLPQKLSSQSHSTLFFAEQCLNYKVYRHLGSQFPKPRDTWPPPIHVCPVHDECLPSCLKQNAPEGSHFSIHLLRAQWLYHSNPAIYARALY